MKQNSKSLKLKKFTIAKLNDSQKVIGGTGKGDATDTDVLDPNCVTTSRIRVP